MSNFESRITSLEKEIEALKAVKYRSAAEMTTETKSIVIYPTVKGSTISRPGQPDEKTVVGSKYGCVRIDLADIGFVSVAVASGYTGRKMYSTVYANNGKQWIYKFWVYGGTAGDIAYCNGDPNIELTIPLDLRITTTSVSSLTAYQE